MAAYAGQSLFPGGPVASGRSASGGRGAAPSEAVQVIGLAELSRALKDIDPRLQRELGKRFRVEAARVRDDVRRVMPIGRRRPGHKPGTARAAITSGGTATTAWVKESNTRVPYVGWLDFGGVLKPTGRRYNTQRRPLTSGRRGRYLYPTVDRHLPKIEGAAEAALNKTARELGLNA